MIKNIHHISILISAEKTVDFYKILGFTEKYRKLRNNDVVILLDGYGIQLEVFIDNRHPFRKTGVAEPLGLRHFALQVDDIAEEVAVLKTKFNKAGLNVEFGVISKDWNGERYCFFSDPDGNIIEVHE